MEDKIQKALDKLSQLSLEDKFLAYKGILMTNLPNLEEEQWHIAHILLNFVINYKDDLRVYDYFIDLLDDNMFPLIVEYIKEN